MKDVLGGLRSKGQPGLREHRASEHSRGPRQGMGLCRRTPELTSAGTCRIKCLANSPQTDWTSHRRETREQAIAQTHRRPCLAWCVCKLVVGNESRG